MAWNDIPVVLLEVAAIVLAARVVGRLAERARQPRVLGELLAGVAIGGLTLAGPGPLANAVAAMRVEGSHVQMLAELGVLLLLFQVGLESKLRELATVGWRAMLVAVVGIVFPLVLGYVACLLYPHPYPEQVDSRHVHLFVGAVLTATSVGITARVFRDMDQLRSSPARIVLAAAVLDDILALMTLAVVAGIVKDGAGGSTGAASIALTVATKAVVFVVLAVLAGVTIGPAAFRLMARLDGPEGLTATALAFCFMGAYGAHSMGLATIVGAFLAGLVIDQRHVCPFAPDCTSAASSLDALRSKLEPVGGLFIPVFFVAIGMRVRLELFLDPRVFAFAACLIAAAVLGKLACALPVSGDRRVKLAVAVGMIPRGEVGLIFASIGQSLGIVNDAVFAALVVTIMSTTLVAPPLLRSLMRSVDTPPPSTEGASDALLGGRW